MTGGRRRLIDGAALGAVLVTTAVVLVVLGRREYIGYDSYWHVFIARQDRWPDFWREVHDNAHPPLFYLLLRVAWYWLGPGLLAYRLVSIAATVAATAIVSAIVRRTTSNRPLAIVAAAAFGLSYGAIAVGLEVRAYALCAAFTLLAFLCYLDWLAVSPRRPTARAAAGFAIAATLAVLTHYSTFFFLAAALATPAILAIVSRAWRQRIAARVVAHPLQTVLMFGAPIAAATAAYVVHVGAWGGRLGHVPDFMFNPSTETASRFLVRNTANLAAIVLPGGDESVPGIHTSIQWLALALIGGVAVAGLIQIGRARAPRLAAVPVVLTLVMVALNVVTGLTRRYPYGGAPRHEFFIVQFAVVAVFSLIEVARRGAPRRARNRGAVAAVAACGVAASIASWTSMFRVDAQAMFQPQIDEFRRAVPAPRAVLLDQFSFINFFSHYHQWRWHATAQWPDRTVWQLWSVTNGADRFAVCRGGQWSFDMSSVATYDSVLECGQRAGVGRVAIFRTHWLDGVPATAALDRTRAAEDGLTPAAYVVTGDDVAAEFEIDPSAFDDCTAPPEAPRDLRVTQNRHRTVTLAWDSAVGMRTSYVVEAGLRSNSSDVLNLTVGRTTAYTATSVTPATYYARVRARNICGISPASSEIRVTVE
jgi:hypothetical protein